MKHQFRPFTLVTGVVLALIGAIWLVREQEVLSDDEEHPTPQSSDPARTPDEPLAPINDVEEHRQSLLRFWQNSTIKDVIDAFLDEEYEQNTFQHIERRAMASIVLLIRD